MPNAGDGGVVVPIVAASLVGVGVFEVLVA